MADNALAAILLANQRKQYDPAERSRAFAQQLMKEGSSTAPVQSGLEGLARALQGGVGGFFAGQADRAEKDKQRNTTEGLLSYANANTDEERALAQTKLQDADPSIVAAIASQLIGRKQELASASTNAGIFGQAYGAAGAPPAIGGGQSGPLTIDIKPLPTAIVPPGGFANNTGNIRATPGVSFPGQGAPQNGFMTFDTPQSGVNAQAANFGAYVKQNPDLTVAQALTKWAPPNENNTQQYISTIVENSGVNPGIPLAEVMKDPGAFAALLDAQTRIEKGGMPAGVTADTFMAAGGSAPGPAPAVPPNAVAQAGAPTVLPSGPQLTQGDGAVTQVGDSTTSSPPSVPRPQPTPDQVKRYQALIGTGKMSVDQANKELNAELLQQWQTDKQVALETWKDQQASKRQTEKAAIDLTQKAPLETIAKRVDQYETKIRPAAEAASGTVATIHQTRQLLDQGAFTGTGAEAKLATAKIAEMLGMDPAAATANTQVLQAQLAKQVIAGMGGSLGTGVSNADRDFMEKANAGQITWTDKSLRQLLDVNERAARHTLSNHDAEAARLMKLPGMSGMSEQYKLSPTPTYEEWQKANPPLAPSASSAPPAAANIPTVSSPEEASKLPSGTQFKTPDGRIKVVP